MAFQERLRNHRRVFLVYDERIDLNRARRWIPREAVTIGEHALPSGERAKNLASIEMGWNALQEAGADRSTLLVAVGGGSTTDAAGFMGSTFKRGMDLAYIPTTVVGMVDAALGGKTGINLGHVKNQIGTFHPPLAVGIDVDWLDTLPVSDVLSGWMEMLKHAYIDGEVAVEQAHGIMKLEEIRGLIGTSARVKLRVVEADPKESGVRKALNFGHTVGHALESASWAQGAPLPHGIAVGFGMAFAIRASVELGAGLSEQQGESALSRLKHWLGGHHLLQADPDELWSLMQHDKKNRDGVVMAVWLRDWGQPIWDQPLKKEDFLRIWSKTSKEYTR